jgi:hypothetical protein
LTVVRWLLILELFLIFTTIFFLIQISYSFSSTDDNFYLCPITPIPIVGQSNSTSSSNHEVSLVKQDQQINKKIEGDNSLNPSTLKTNKFNDFILENNEVSNNSKIKSFDQLLFRLENFSQVETSSVPEDCVREQSTISGTLGIVHADSFDESSSYESYIIKSNTDEKITNLYTTSRLDNFQDEMNITASGFVFNNSILVDTKSGRFGIISNDNVYNISPLPVEGHQNIAIILVNFDDEYYPSYNKSMLENTIDELNRFYTINSGNRVSISGDIYGPYNITHIDGSQGKCPSFVENILDRHTDQILRLTEDNIHYPSYNRLIIIAPYQGALCDQNKAWTSDVGNTRIKSTIDGSAKFSSIYARTDALVNTSQALRILGHELGHNFGMLHASALECPDKAFPPSSARYEDECTGYEYGDPYDIMGIFGHLNGPHLEYLGWLSDSNIEVINSVNETTMVFTLHPIEMAINDLKILKIKRDSNDFLYLEFRQPLTFNQTIGYQSDIFNGAILHLVIPGKNASNPFLLDGTPDDIIAGDFYEIALRPGSTLSDPLSGIAIRVDEIIEGDPDGLAVELYRGDP